MRLNCPARERGRILVLEMKASSLREDREREQEEERYEYHKGLVWMKKLRGTGLFGPYTPCLP